MSVMQLDDQTFDEVVGGSALPVLVDVTAEWCPPCRAMEPILQEISDEWADSLLVASVDADAHPDVARHLGVMSFPSLIVFVGGVERARFIGARGKGRMLEALVPFLSPVDAR